MWCLAQSPHSEENYLKKTPARMAPKKQLKRIAVGAHPTDLIGLKHDLLTGLSPFTRELVWVRNAPTRKDILSSQFIRLLFHTAPSARSKFRDEHPGDERTGNS